VKKIIIISVALLFFSFKALASSTITELVNIPTAHTLVKGFFDLNCKMYNEGGVFVKIDLGITNRLTIGTSLDVEKVIGDQKMESDLPPFISAKYHLLDGTKYIPAIVAIGYNSLGYPRYEGKIKFSSQELKGPYLSFTKPILPLGLNGHAHAGVNFDTHGFKDSSIYLGLNLFINPELLLVLEANSIRFNHQEEEKNVHGGIRFAVNQQFEIELDFKNLSHGSVTRQVKIRYLSTLF